MEAVSLQVEEESIWKRWAKKIDKLSNQLTELRWDMWFQHTLFTWQWWMLVFACVISLGALLLLIDKKQSLRMAAYLGIIYILNKNLDDVATALDWYDYRMQLEPIIPTMLPVNLFFIPMGLTLVYQFFSSWKKFLIALGVFSAGVSYVSLPLMKLAGIYMEKHWNAHLSMLSLVVMAVLAKLLIDRLSLFQSRIRLIE
ncbi:hypothetical protein [Paenibacillus mucilaginosus]|uniref:Transmembrane protein n=2 Tax=Paenibacillus mucilaginosus TaxID=61624 RepID=H6NK86_9BACL|nr:hypothetical protein [Paenibacillus mucilaginosus]AEI43989.1 hypothetical protein KNP414_05465 [Paenibacillus mucilaginosus KNP414]AFC31570.1 hypothetical protein PM3016_4834 [Paenibacillus mucilaginosus 3016]MCG7212520.1 hypothetical protein [Paenibacillus mucilaginosus]WDM25449.1 hypothetical protein KCX80_23700 [Paenibacillus mucilaginosus]WFA20108.1 hypothetical protein ERY13_24150 [Paenibacillus mucilaginosus]